MSKLGLKTILAAAAMGLAACGESQENNMAIENVEDLNATEDMNIGMDMNADMNADMNMGTDMNTMDNATANALDNATDNAATTNSY